MAWITGGATLPGGLLWSIFTDLKLCGPLDGAPSYYWGTSARASRTLILISDVRRYLLLPLTAGGVSGNRTAASSEIQIRQQVRYQLTHREFSRAVYGQVSE